MHDSIFFTFIFWNIQKYWHFDIFLASRIHCYGSSCTVSRNHTWSVAPGGHGELSFCMGYQEPEKAHWYLGNTSLLNLTLKSKSNPTYVPRRALQEAKKKLEKPWTTLHLKPSDIMKKVQMRESFSTWNKISFHNASSLPLLLNTLALAP